MGEIIDFPGNKKYEIETSLEKLKDLLRNAGKDQHYVNKQALLKEFDKLSQELIDNGYFASEEAIVSVLEERGSENPRAVLKLLRLALEE